MQFPLNRVQFNSYFLFFPLLDPKSHKKQEDDFEDDLQSLTTEMKGNSLLNPTGSESGLSDQEQVKKQSFFLPFLLLVARALLITKFSQSQQQYSVG